MVTESEYEDNCEKSQEFLKEFKALIRKYVPDYPETTEKELQLLYMIGDCTSVFNPYVWSDDTSK
jgi:hypothetical protein